MPLTCGSRILEGYMPPYQATVVDRLATAGAVLLGKTNTDEFAMGSSTENSAYFTTRNPWDLSRVPGGSSGGSAAAVAADLCLAALGSDTGGSVRQPASLCGIVGLKPTYGRVSRYGLVAYASSLDQIGPLAKDVTDAALLLGAIAGHDPAGQHQRRRARARLCGGAPTRSEGDSQPLEGLRVGVPKEYFVAGHAAGGRGGGARGDRAAGKPGRGACARSACRTPTWRCRSTTSSRRPRPRPTWRASTASATGCRWRRSRCGTPTGARAGEGFGAEVKRRIMLGAYALSAGYYDAYYLKAQQVRTLIKADFDAALQEVDVIACPTSPTTAFPIGERAADPLSMYLADIFTLSLNLAGICGLSLPCGFDADGPADRAAADRRARSKRSGCCRPRMPTNRRRNGIDGSRSLKQVRRVKQVMQ